MSTIMMLNDTLRTQDPARPLASALSVVGNRIQAIGNDGEVCASAASPAEIIDLDGRLVMP